MEEQKFRMQIRVPKTKPKPVYRAERITLRDKLLTKLFGRRQQYVIIMPSALVDSITVEPVEGRKDE